MREFECEDLGGEPKMFVCAIPTDKLESLWGAEGCKRFNGRSLLSHDGNRVCEIPDGELDISEGINLWKDGRKDSRRRDLMLLFSLNVLENKREGLSKPDKFNYSEGKPLFYSDKEMYDGEICKHLHVNSEGCQLGLFREFVDKLPEDMFQRILNSGCNWRLRFCNNDDCGYVFCYVTTKNKSKYPYYRIKMPLPSMMKNFFKDKMGEVAEKFHDEIGIKIGKK